MERPRILVTRRWPENVERELAARFDTTLNGTDRALGQEDIAAAMREFDAP